jgi:DNA-binding NtrC family response regulator
MRRQAPRLLILDDDQAVLAQVGRLFGPYYTVVQLSNPMRAMALVESDPGVSVFLTEQVMRFGNGVELLDAVRTVRPGVRRAMLTNYSDLASIVGGLHSGAIQHLVQKPANDAELLAAVAPELMQSRTAWLKRASA